MSDRSPWRACARRLPPDIELVPGPGCPVCVCPEEIIYQAIRAGARRRASFSSPSATCCACRSMSPKGEVRSLEQARAAGGDIVPIASPLEAVASRGDNPDRRVVFFAAGFETTTAPVAAMLAEGVPDNLSVLLAGRRTWPAVAMLLESETPGFDALDRAGPCLDGDGAGGMGFRSREHGIPTAVAGFTAESLRGRALFGVAPAGRGALLPRQLLSRGGAARRQSSGAAPARRARWTSSTPTGAASASSRHPAMRCATHLPRHDARGLSRRPAMTRASAPGKCRRAATAPAWCSAASIPINALLYGRACTPRTPIGPCMVSDEGACRIWWASGVRAPRELAHAA